MTTTIALTDTERAYLHRRCAGRDRELHPQAASGDPIFDERRLAEIYDPLDPDRSDLDAYAAIVGEFAAGSVLDIGCGTGTFACLLASRGIAVVGVDPAGARSTWHAPSHPRSGCDGCTVTRQTCLPCRWTSSP